MFDVIDEFVGFLKNLGFVFSGEVVKPRISKHLENRGRFEGASERASERMLSSHVSTLTALLTGTTLRRNGAGLLVETSVGLGTLDCNHQPSTGESGRAVGGVTCFYSGVSSSSSPGFLPTARCHRPPH